MGLPFILGISFSLFGAIYGFIWEWGPIIWGGLAFLIGIFTGFLIDFILFKIHNKSKRKDSLTEVIVMIHCDKTKEDDIVNIFWEQGAFGVAKVNI